MDTDQKVVMPYCGEEVEDLLFMLSQDPAWQDHSKITLRVGRVELERLLATALNAS